MSELTATARSHPNIALIKYWGNKDHNLRIPENGSISFNLDGLTTTTTVEFDPSFKNDTLIINGEEATHQGLKRVTNFLEIVRRMALKPFFAKVTSENNFPMGAGIASSAAAFSALSLAASKAIGLDLSEQALSRLARRGSGSASRSVPAGFVEWFPGSTDQNSYAESIASPEHWDLVDLIAVITKKHKSVGSTAGHALANSSPLQSARIADTPRRLGIVRNAIRSRNFAAMAETIEQDSNIMHGVMMTSNPPLIYMEPATISILKSVPTWRLDGARVCFTMDAGPNVHVICHKDDANSIHSELNKLNGIEDILTAKVGGGAKLIEN